MLLPRGKGRDGLTSSTPLPGKDRLSSNTCRNSNSACTGCLRDALRDALRGALRDGWQELHSQKASIAQADRQCRSGNLAMDFGATHGLPCDLLSVDASLCMTSPRLRCGHSGLRCGHSGLRCGHSGLRCGHSGLHQQHLQVCVHISEARCDDTCGSKAVDPRHQVYRFLCTIQSNETGVGQVGISR